MLNKVIVLTLLLGLASALPRNDHKLLKAFHTRQSGKLGVFDGKTTTITDHPYIASIVYNNEVFCEGAILSENWIITDGDCIYGLSKSDLSVVVGSNDGTTGTSYSIKMMVLHSKYDYGSYFYDYALIKIKGSFTWRDSVANVSLPSSNPATKQAFVVAGYGYSREVNDRSLLQGTLKWQSNSTCKKYYEDMFGWYETSACAYNKGKATLCEGDWGAPFVKDGVLYGVFVGGLSTYFCTKEAWPVIISNVLPVVDWIQAYTGAVVAQS